MTTALKIIKAGFRKATINSGVKPLTGQETADALEILNDVIKEWSALGIVSIEPVLSTDTDLKEPEYATKALKYFVGGEICVEFGKPIDPGFAMMASSAFNTMLTMASPTQDVDYPDNFPMGSGNYEAGEDLFFPKTDLNNF